MSLSITCGFLASTEKFCQNAAKTQINEIKSQKSFKSLQIEPKYVQIVCNNCRHRFCTFAGRIPGRCLNVIFLPNSTEGIYFLLTPLQAYNWKSLEKLKMHMDLWKNNLHLLCSPRHCRRRGIRQWTWFRCFRRWRKRWCSIVHVLWDIKESDWHAITNPIEPKYVEIESNNIK